MSFLDELDRWGPDNIAPVLTGTAPTGTGEPSGSDIDSQTPSLSLAEAQAYCRTLATSHYENFPLVSWLLPRRLYQHFYNVYAYCRWSDDLADETGDPQRALELLRWWRGLLADCYQGSAQHPVFIALADTIREFDIPIEPFQDLLDAFEQDQRVLEYESFDDLLQYCQGSANPVGRLVLRLCRQYNDETVAWSDAVCTGLQLANFWQDVGRDLDIDRVYLPREDCQRFGYTHDDLHNRVTNAAFRDLMRFQVERTREYLNCVFPLADHLPGRLRIDIELFGRGGLKILDRIEANDYSVWDQRPTVGKRDVAAIILAATTRGLLGKIRRSRTDKSRSEADLENSYAYCKSLARRTGKNFYVSFLGLPADQFRAMCVLYAFMRVSDDLGDDPDVPIPNRIAALQDWQDSLRDALDDNREVPSSMVSSSEVPSSTANAESRAGQGTQIFPALSDVVRRYQIPPAYLFAVIDGIRMDLQPVPISGNGQTPSAVQDHQSPSAATPCRFQTFDQLADYCYHVAGAVGQCCIHIWGFHDPRAVESAVDCGLAFQLTNILRDLAEDVDNNRIYLPQHDLDRFHYSPQDIAAHRQGEAFTQLMQFEIDRARSYYNKAETLFDYLDPSGKPILRAMLKIYGGLLTEIERRNYDVYTRPIKLPKWRKLLIAANTITHHRWQALRQ